MEKYRKIIGIRKFSILSAKANISNRQIFTTELIAVQVSICQSANEWVQVIFRQTQPTI
jgi:hypothetical protein